MKTEDILRKLLIAAGYAPFIASIATNFIISPPRKPYTKSFLKRHLQSHCDSANESPLTPVDYSKAVSNTAGFVSLEIFLGQILMGSRFPLIENLFGFDKVMLQHRKLAYTAIALASLHVGLKAYAKAANSSNMTKVILSYLFSPKGFRPYIYGRISFWGSALAILIAYFQIQPDRTGFLPYYFWKSAHYLLYPLVGLACYHAYSVGPLQYPRKPRPAASKGLYDTVYAMKKNEIYKRQMIGVALKRAGWWLYVLTGVAVSAWRIHSRWTRDSDCSWKVVGIHPDTDNTVTVTLAPPAHQRSFNARKPGQFAIIRKLVGSDNWSRSTASSSSNQTDESKSPLLNKDPVVTDSSNSSSSTPLSMYQQIKKFFSADNTKDGWFPFLPRPSTLKWSEPHPFTIRNATKDLNIQLSIKSFPQGKFTPFVKDWKIGDIVLVEGPFGTFTPDFETEKNIIMIAGGVGITPFLSILNHAMHQNVNNTFTLIWGVQTQKDLFALEEFQRMKSVFKSRFKLVIVFSSPGAQEEYVKSPSLHEATSIYQGFVTKEILSKHITPQDASYYLCGPPIMKKIINQQLYDLFKVTDIHYELFAW